MDGAKYSIPVPQNEPVLSYSPGSDERKELKHAIETARASESDLPMIIGGREVRTDKKIRIHPPHEIKHTLGYYSQGGKKEVQMAIDAALKAKLGWMNTSWEQRASVFLKAADLLSGPYRAKMNAATMLGQSKNAFQAEIDSACELIDFFRFNAKFMENIYTMQPNSVKGVWNRTDWRPLEGFVFALTPFNFTSIAGNLPTAPAMLGNTVVWKPSKSQIYSASVIMELLLEAGLPDGVINMVFASGPDVADVVLNHRDFAGIHFTGSTGVFQNIWKTIGDNIDKYRSYPRIVGETGGKDFVLVHPSADVSQVVTALVRGAFEFQGQKCSAASRAYIPYSLRDVILAGLKKDLDSVKTGPPEDFRNFINAVIDETSFDKLTGVIESARKDKDAEILFGGKYDKSKGYFIEPTVILTANPQYFTMEEELFGPVLTVYIYPDKEFDEVLTLVDTTSEYALTGAVFAKDRNVIARSSGKLRFAAGNFYINDKPTGAVVGQQPFGGSRGSGTNDKAGSLINLLRWLSPRSIKENLNPPADYGYPFLNE
ncbi:MAG: L-glutamate gamma-semialdehyde dehydrogenase [Bacteroidales bacterium]